MQEGLNNRQFDQASGFLTIVEDFGPWNQGPFSDGAHYFSSEDNPFIDEGMVCGNCIFWEPSGHCQIVSGRIDMQGLCKLWIIPDQLVEV
tara:strand:- start:125 stop:394 length:270 start_codon:yes stop_codon:yes gene_type:complete